MKVRSLAVEVRIADRGRMEYRSRCPICDVVGPTRKTDERAMDDAVRHVADVHPL